MTLENKWILLNALRSRKVRRKGKELEWSANPMKSLYLFLNFIIHLLFLRVHFFYEYTSSYNNEKCRLAPLKIPAQGMLYNLIQNTCPCHVLSPSPSKPQCTFHSNALTESSIRCLPWLTSCRCYTLTLSFTQTHQGTPAYRYVSISLLCICGSWSLVFLVAVAAIPGFEATM